MLFKTKREQARICSLLKRYCEEARHEEAAWNLFTAIYGKVVGWYQKFEDIKGQKFKLDYLPTEKEPEKAPEGMVSMNVKLFKMVFNRALRMKSRDSKVGEKMFLYLRERLATMLGTPDTYYASSLCFELVRTSTQLEKN